MPSPQRVPRQKSTNEEPEQSLNQICKHLSRGEGDEACALFHRVSATRWVPRRPDTAAISAEFARLACHFCQGEQTPCGRCGGLGETPDRRACEHRAGLAVARCEACNGSGLANYDAVPLGLRHAVLRRRLADAALTFRATRARIKTGGAEALHDHVMTIVGLRAMLENALYTARTQTPRAVTSPDYIPKANYESVKRLCAKLGAESEVGLRQALAKLASEYLFVGSADGPVAVSFRRRGEHMLHVSGRARFKSPLLIRKELERIG